MRKTALLTGAAGLFLMTAPAFAQDSTAPQTPPATTTTEAPAQAPALTLQPGSTVRGSDGDLGTLVGARLNGGRQQLTVQGADGTVRAVPIDGIRQDGDVVVVDFTLAQFGTADTVTQPATPATPAEPGVTPATPATPAVPGNRAPVTEDDMDDDADVDDGTEVEEGEDRGATPATPAVPATRAEPGMNPAVPATRAQPATPPARTPPTLPEDSASPRPGEGQGNANGNGNNPTKPNG